MYNIVIFVIFFILHKFIRYFKFLNNSVYISFLKNYKKINRYKTYRILIQNY